MVSETTREEGGGAQQIDHTTNARLQRLDLPPAKGESTWAGYCKAALQLGSRVATVS